jgi:hypothetical protein
MVHVVNIDGVWARITYAGQEFRTKTGRVFTSTDGSGQLRGRLRNEDW